MPDGSLSKLRKIVDDADKKFLEASKEKGPKIFDKCAEGFKILKSGANLIKNFGSASDKRAWKKIEGDVEGFLKADSRGTGVKKLSDWLKGICGNLPYSGRIITFFTGAKLGKIGENLSAISKKLPGVLKAAGNTLSNEVKKKLVGPLSEAEKEMGKEDDFDSDEFLSHIVDFCSNLKSFCDKEGKMFEIMGMQEQICACQVNGKMTNTDRYVDEIASGEGEFEDVAAGFHEICVQFGANAGGSAFEEVVDLMKRIDKFMSELA